MKFSKDLDIQHCQPIAHRTLHYLKDSAFLCFCSWFFTCLLNKSSSTGNTSSCFKWPSCWNETGNGARGLKGILDARGTLPAAHGTLKASGRTFCPGWSFMGGCQLYLKRWLMRKQNVCSTNVASVISPCGPVQEKLPFINTILIFIFFYIFLQRFNTSFWFWKIKHKKHNFIVTRSKCPCQIRCNEQYLLRIANYSLPLLCSHILLEVLCKWASQKPFSRDSPLVWSCVATIKILLSDLLLQGATLVDYPSRRLSGWWLILGDDWAWWEYLDRPIL